jgi:ribonuclease P protein component
MPDVRLRKEERLKSRKQLGILFAEGQSTLVFPIRFVWMITSRDGAYPVRVAFSVARRRWKRAVDRNLFKRRMRESYRLHKHLLYDILTLPVDQQILISCLYTADTECPFEQVHTAMGKGIKRIAEQISQSIK